MSNKAEANKLVIIGVAVLLLAVGSYFFFTGPETGGKFIQIQQYSVQECRQACNDYYGTGVVEDAGPVSPGDTTPPGSGSPPTGGPQAFEYAKACQQLCTMASDEDRDGYAFLSEESIYNIAKDSNLDPAQLIFPDLDCDDAQALMNPGQQEVQCNALDDDCDASTQDDVDADNDGYICDCNENDASVNPGATEVCTDNKDNDCNGDVDFADYACYSDRDMDGYASELYDGDDCDDTDANINPGATEVCDDNVDNNCNGKVDADDAYCYVRGTIFASSATYNGDLGGLSGADSKCNALASNADLPGTWTALLSTPSVDAKDRILDTTYYNTRGELLANSKSDLFDGSIVNAIKYDETRGLVSTITVWTASDNSGEYQNVAIGSAPNCNGWTYNGRYSNGASDRLSRAKVGDSGSTTEWILDYSTHPQPSRQMYNQADNERNCGSANHLYCVRTN